MENEQEQQEKAEQAQAENSARGHWLKVQRDRVREAMKAADVDPVELALLAELFAFMVRWTHGDRANIAKSAMKRLGIHG